MDKDPYWLEKLQRNMNPFKMAEKISHLYRLDREKISLTYEG